MTAASETIETFFERPILNSPYERPEPLRVSCRLFGLSLGLLA